MVMMYLKELCVLHNNNHNNCHTHKIGAKKKRLWGCDSTGSEEHGI